MRDNGEEGHRGARDELGSVYTVAPRTGQLNIGDEFSLREAQVGKVLRGLD